ncbi:MAG: HAD family hydrolase [Phycisphaerae bacterium]
MSAPPRPDDSARDPALAAPPRPALLIFDLDGTLTVPMLDFDAIRAEIGLPPGPILESVSRMTGAARQRAEAILERHESRAAAESALQPNAAAVLARLRTARIPVALMTRNTPTSVAAFQARHGLTFDHVRTRADGVVKPDPRPVLDICACFGVAPQASCVVGDFRFDVECGRAAGATTVLLLPPGPTPDWAALATHVIRDLAELLPRIGLA